MLSRVGLVLLALVVAVPEAPAQAAAQARAAFSRRRLMPTEEVQYTITVSAEKLARTVATPAPDFSEFDVIDGPAVGTSQQVSIVNGQITQSQSRTYSWLLVPRKEGSVAVPAVTVDIGGGNTVTAGRVVIEVSPSSGTLAPPGGAPGGAPTPPPATRQPPAQPRARAEPNRPWEPAQRESVLQVVAVVDTDTPWLGQEIVLTHVLRYDVDVETYGMKSAPDFPGFANTPQDVGTPQGRAVREGSTGATRYFEAALARWALVPLSAGVKTIPGQGYVISVRDNSMGGFFGGFGGGAFRREVASSTQPVRIQVRALPEGAPPSFSGAVGTFRVSASVDSPSVRAGDGIVLTVTVEGKGSFRAVRPPQVVVPEGMKIFEPETSEAAGLDPEGRTQGSKTFRYPVLVGAAGLHEIPAIEWTFFDPSAARYVTRAVGPLTVQASPGTEQAMEMSASAAATAAVEARGADIRHLAPALGSWRPDLQGRLPAWAWMVAAAGPLLNLLLLGAGLVTRLRETDPAARRSRGAAARARAHLKAARAARGARQPVAAADAVARAVAGMVADRWQLGAELSPSEAARALAAADPQLAADVEALLTSCDVARFASGADGQAPADLIRRGESLVSRIGAVKPPRAPGRA